MNVHYVIASSKQYKVIAGVCVGVVSTLIFLGCFGYWFYKRYYKEELQIKEQKAKKLREMKFQRQSEQNQLKPGQD